MTFTRNLCWVAVLLPWLAGSAGAAEPAPHAVDLNAGKDPIDALAFTPDGKGVVGGSQREKTVRLWLLPDGQQPEHLVREYTATAVAVSPDGTWLALSHPDQPTVRIVDKETGKRTRALDAEGKGTFTTVAISADGRYVAATHADLVVVWELASGKELLSLSKQTAQRHDAFAPDAPTRLVAEHLRNLFNVRGVAFSPDGKTLAVGGDSVRVLDVATGKERAAFAGYSWANQPLAFSPDGARLAYATFQGVRLWDLRGGKELAFFDGFPNEALAVCFAPDGKTVAGASKYGGVKAWDVASGELRFALDGLANPGGSRSSTVNPLVHPSTSLAFSADGKHLAMGTVGLVRVWDVPALTAAQPSPGGAALVRSLAGPPGEINALAYSPDGKLVAAGNRKGAITVLEATTGKALHSFTAAGGYVQDLAFAPDGKTLAATVGAAVIKWDLATGKQGDPVKWTKGLKNLCWRGAEGQLIGVQDNQLVLLGGREPRLLKLKSTAQVQLLRLTKKDAAALVLTARGVTEVDLTSGESTVTPGPAGVTWRTLLPDNQVALGTKQSALVLWDRQSGRDWELAQCDQNVEEVALSPDGKWLAGSHKDGTVRIWDVAGRKERAQFQAHATYLRAIVFAPDGKTFVTGAGDGTVKVWDLARALTPAPEGSKSPPDRPPTPPAPPAKPNELGLKAQQILRANCYECHGKDGSAEGGFNTMLDRDRLVATGRIVPKEPNKSLLLRRIDRGEMPPAGQKNRPSAEDLAVLTRWVEAGAPGWAGATTRQFIPIGDVGRLVQEDRKKMDEKGQENARYLMLTPLYNGGVSDEELETLRVAFSKVLNSVSHGPNMVVPTAIDPARTVYRIDLRDYGLARTWTLVERQNPYGHSWDAGSGRRVEMPARIDWFVFAASRPPLYHQLLDVPETLTKLETALKVDAAGDIRAAKVARAGFNGSGVARNNRLIERHEGKDGYYWRSYDFAAGTDRKNLFTFPTGPAPGQGTFQHDGGEIIFRLPNGLQGYMLVDARGNRIDRGPTNIVSDPKHPDKVVENGISCMSCHARGLIDKADQVRAHVEKNADSFSDEERKAVLALYTPRDKFAALVAADAKGYQEAAVKTGAKVSATEPIVVAALRFESDLTLPQAAAEAWVTPAEFLRRLGDFPALARTLGPLGVEGGTIPRQTYVRAFGGLLSAFKVAEFTPAFHARTGPPEVPARPVLIQASGDFDGGSLQPVEYERKHQNVMAGPVLDPTFQRAAVMEGRTSLQIVDLKTGKCLAALKDQADYVSLAFSPNGELLAAGDRQQTVRVWETATGTLKWQTERKPDRKATWGTIWALAFSPDGKRLAGTGASEGDVVLWHADTGKAAATLTGHTRAVTRLVFAPDGNTLLAGSAAWGSSGVKVWDLKTGKARAALNPDDSVQSFACSPDGKKYVTAGGNGTVRLWDAASNDEAAADRLRTSDKQAVAVLEVAFSGDGKYLATIHEDGCLTLWDAVNLRDLTVLKADKAGMLRTVLFSPDDNRLATTSKDGTIRFWNVKQMIEAQRKP